jgi:hypothetical protein
VWKETAQANVAAAASPQQQQQPAAAAAAVAVAVAAVAVARAGQALTTRRWPTKHVSDGATINGVVLLAAAGHSCHSLLACRKGALTRRKSVVG